MDEVDLSSLPKKERKRLKRQMERKEFEEKKKKGSLVKWFIVGILIVLAGIGGWFIIREFTKPLPGQQLADLGRDHVAKEQWEKFGYNSNPPTSGPHDEQWVKAGVYDTPQPEGQLIHALEHGYINISYNCGQSVESTPGANLPSSLSENDCNNLKKQLSDVANDKKLWKLIVVPRPNLDSRIAITAWTWVEKLNDFDSDRIAAFIDAHRNHGPEQTME